MLLVLVRLGAVYISDGTASRLVCRKPPMSPSADSSGAPVGGLIRSRTAVSSMPLAITEMLTVPPVSHAVRLFVPYRVAPVPYIIRLELNGSISSASVIQPSFGVTSGSCGFAPNVSHGAADTFIEYRKLRFG